MGGLAGAAVRGRGLLAECDIAHRTAFSLYPFLTARCFSSCCVDSGAGDYRFCRAGVWLGIGLHGFAARIAPLWVLSALLYSGSTGNRRHALAGAGMAVIAGIHDITGGPAAVSLCDGSTDLVMQRSLTRLSDSETAIQGRCADFPEQSVACADNAVWDNGVVWVHSIPGRPALASLDAASFVGQS